MLVIFGPLTYEQQQAVSCHPLVCLGYTRAALHEGQGTNERRLLAFSSSAATPNYSSASVCEQPWLVSPLANEDPMTVKAFSAN